MRPRPDPAGPGQESVWSYPRCSADGETVVPQPGDFYGGWITSALAGPFKGVPGSRGW
jgi:hypothetical protein